MKVAKRHVPKDIEDEYVSLLPEDPEDMVSFTLPLYCPSITSLGIPQKDRDLCDDNVRSSTNLELPIYSGMHIILSFQAT